MTTDDDKNKKDGGSGDSGGNLDDDDKKNKKNGSLHDSNPVSSKNYQRRWKQQLQERRGSMSSSASDYSASEKHSDFDPLSPRMRGGGKKGPVRRFLHGQLLNDNNKATGGGGNRDGQQQLQQQQNDGSRSHLSNLIRRRQARQQYVRSLLKKNRPTVASTAEAGVDKGDEEMQAGGQEFDQIQQYNGPLVNDDNDGGGAGVRNRSVPVPGPPTVASFTRYKSEETFASTVSSLGDGDVEGIRAGDILSEDEKDELRKEAEGLLGLKEEYRLFKDIMWQFPVEIRLSNVTFSVPFTASSMKIKTVYNSSFVYDLVRMFKRWRSGQGLQKEPVLHKKVLDGINLSLKPGKMYLLLGPPGSGKSSLLKAIAGRLPRKKGIDLHGSVTYNGMQIENQTEIHIENAISFVAQLDRHAPRYTVKETFQFAFNCKRRNGHHVDFRYVEDTPENRKLAKEADDRNLIVTSTMKYLGIDHVADTFVGDDEIRGVSGGQRRRVTIGEMLMNNAPVICGDEISNGLDASSTYDIINVLMHSGKVRKRLQVISLLQPSPETVSLFDEVILIAEGKLLFAGPIQRVETYFASLGYKAPVHMDVADFLQLVSTPEGATLYDPPPEIAEVRSGPYTIEELADEFKMSKYGRAIGSDIREAYRQVWGSQHGDVAKLDDVEFLDDRRFQNKYANKFGTSTLLNLRRQLTLWKRDKRVLIANTAKNIIMGISVGGVFFQTDDVISILGVFFQGMLFVMLGGMVSAPGFVDERSTFYKQADANFFSAFPFVFAKSISKLPQTLMDCINFGVILYYMVGLSPEPEYFFQFMGVIFVFSVLMTEFLFVFSTFAKTKALVQVASACLVFFFMLFCGFFIAPDLIPGYYSWIYWYNPLAWAYRSLVINEFTSTRYTPEETDRILRAVGFVDSNGDTFTRDWIKWGYAYMCGHLLLTVLTSATILSLTRVYGDPPPSQDEIDKSNQALMAKNDGEDDVNITFRPITLSFENVCYDVKGSTTGEDLRLLNDVSGYFKAGEMTCLMGSSGAGKTTLMDVIALRKTSGSIVGDIRVNGFPQDPLTFRRCTGYVEQFDVTTPQLTVRETVLFSARLRLDANKVATNEAKAEFCDFVLRTLELWPLKDSLVGSAEEGGLSFEQKKRVSIAVELAASPSILFLDEPTTGLDARSALLVVKLLRKIADTGRTVCCTIHQPSSSVFSLFDKLLLLKKGGYSVYFGDIGESSCKMIEYFQRHGAAPIDVGDNPANWMLRILDSETDYADVYLKSPEHETLKKQIEQAKEDPPKELQVKFLSQFAVPAEERQRLMNKRLQTIYWRSPAYNLSRILVCLVIAFILGSVFITERRLGVLTESDARAYFAVTFLSFIIIGILCITAVLPVMLAIRDVFYKQRAAGMLDNTALGWALGTAEKGFIVLSSALFCLVFLATAGTFENTIRRSIKFWGFFTFNLAIYSYFGQAFMCLVPQMATAQILCSVFIGLNNFFSGFIVRPQYMTGLFAFTYWITPGHYVFEGLILAQYWNDQRTVLPNQGSEFYNWLNCDEHPVGPDACVGTMTQFLWVFFGGKFNIDNELQDIVVLALFLVVSRVTTFFALKTFNYTNT